MFMSRPLKNVLICVMICCLAVNSFAETHISLKRAITKKMISLNALSKGGHLGKCMKLSITNTSPKEITIDVEPGLIFVPDDTTYQNLVSMGGESVILAPSATKEIDLEAFCGKSYARCPWAKTHYNYYRQGDSNMVKTLAYMKANNVPADLVQRAVWVFTNGHCLSTVYSAQYPQESENLIHYLAAVKKLKDPKYYVSSQLENRPGRSVIVADREKTFINMHWKSDEGYRHMRLFVLKENGAPYKEIEADQIIDKYGSTVQVEFDPRHDPHGTYHVVLRDDANKIWDQKTIVVGGNPCAEY